MFRPPRMFLKWYEELCYQIYMYKEKFEAPIRRTKKMMGSTPMNDMGAVDLKEEIDKVLRTQERRITKYLAEGEDLKRSIDNVCYDQSRKIRKFFEGKKGRDQDYKSRTGYPDNMGVEG